MGRAAEGRRTADQTHSHPGLSLRIKADQHRIRAERSKSYPVFS
jgi:hypothetical protein